MKASGCILGLVAGRVFSVVWMVLELVFTVIAKIIIYFGLYFPILSLIFGGVLFLIFDFNPFGGGVDSNLYVFGLCLSFVCALVVTVRNIIIKPIQKYFIDSKVIEYTGKRHKNAPEAPKI